MNVDPARTKPCNAPLAARDALNFSSPRVSMMPHLADVRNTGQSARL